MTPDEAREHLAWPEGKDHPKVRDGSGRTWFEVQAGESHPYWNRLPDAHYEDAVMYAVARDALATIAGMREEWVVIYDYKQVGGPATFTIRQWKDSADRPLGQYTARRLAGEKVRAGYANVRIVRRYVTTEEEA